MAAIDITVDFIETQKRKRDGSKGRKACSQGYFYIFERNSTLDLELSFWQCERCKCRVHIRRDRIVNISNIGHNHAPDSSRKQMLESIIRLKESAGTTQETTQLILANSVQGLTEAAAGQLPTERSLKRTVQRTRSRRQGFPVQPANLTDLVIPVAYQQFDDGRRFLAYDSGA